MRALTKILTEDELVAAITQAVGEQPRKLIAGIGDDAAVWKVPRSHYSVITTDALVDGVHFNFDAVSARALGHKALAVNLSDVAAMGATPTLAVVAFGITEAIDEPWAREFYKGMSALGRRFGCAIAGGDIVRAASLMIAVTAVGDVRKSGLRLRSGARPGDIACVTGPLGLAAGALRMGERASPKTKAALDEPVPRIREGKFLGASSATHAMMDISDGLSLDLSRMARASRVDAVIDADALVPPKEISQLPDARDLMLYGGDDYELLVAVEARSYLHLARRFAARFGRKLERVARFEKGIGDVWELTQGRKEAHRPRGYDHLRGQQ